MLIFLKIFKEPFLFLIIYVFCRTFEIIFGTLTPILHLLLPHCFFQHPLLALSSACYLQTGYSRLWMCPLSPLHMLSFTDTILFLESLIQIVTDTLFEDNEDNLMVSQISLIFIFAVKTIVFLSNNYACIN